MDVHGIDDALLGAVGEVVLDDGGDDRGFFTEIDAGDRQFGGGAHAVSYTHLYWCCLAIVEFLLDESGRTRIMRLVGDRGLCEGHVVLQRQVIVSQ